MPASAPDQRKDRRRKLLAFSWAPHLNTRTTVKLDWALTAYDWHQVQLPVFMPPLSAR